jgi:hypothetical protein
MNGNILFVSPERFTYVIAIDESALSQPQFAIASYDSVIEGSLWDMMQSRFRGTLWQVNLYDTSLNLPVRYPDLGAIYSLSPRQ